MISATLAPASAAGRLWDAVVIGAGPAGSVAAKCLADRGLAVLLIDGKSFPRSKVCGGCLNRAALAALEGTGLRPAIDALAPVPLHEFRLAAGGWSVRLGLPGGVALSRWGMDAALVRAAIAAGAHFLPETMALVGDVADGVRHVRLEASGQHDATAARIVVAASGLSGRCLSRLPDFRSEEAPFSRIGVEALLDDFPDEYAPGVIFMAVGGDGYVGLTRVEDGRLNVAAAVDPRAVRRAGTPGAACREILAEAGFPCHDAMHGAEWRGTAHLTRRTARKAAERLFVVGDAAGYVEPFTGEGMAWAITSGLEVAGLVEQGAGAWSRTLADDWERRYRRLVERRQWLCRVLAAGLRRPALVRSALPLLSCAPWLAKPVIARLNRLDGVGSSRLPAQR